MLEALLEYFLKPLARAIYSTIRSIIKLDKIELKANLELRLPLILQLGLRPFLEKLWFAWYLRSDSLQMRLGVFDPASTVRRMLRNPLCPKFVIKTYNEYITEDPEFRQKRIKFSLSD